MTMPRPANVANSLPVRLLSAGCILILVLMPFHALLSTWAGTSLGFYIWLKAWKELLLAGLVVLAVYLIVRDRGLRQTLLGRKINVLILAYSLLHAALWAWFRPDSDAAAAGMLINLRFLVLFGLIQAAYYYRPQDWTAGKLTRYVFVPALVVIIFGVLQVTVLPPDFLTNFGYGPDTVEPFMTIDEKPDLIRINSTLRGPNPLGAYLILPLLTLVYLYIKRRRWLWLAGLAPLGVVLFFSHSRSAWLGAAVAVTILVVLELPRRHFKRLAFAAVPFIVTVGAALFLMRDSYFVQNTLFHTDENSQSAVSSNDQHWLALEHSGEDIVQNPLGRGPGSAGPASYYNDAGAKIAENYYLQIGQEVGVLGLVLFAAINGLLVIALWKRRHELWPVVLLASFAGIFVINLFLHGWADDTLGLVWWGMAGAVAFSTSRKAAKVSSSGGSKLNHRTVKSSKPESRNYSHLVAE